MKCDNVYFINGTAYAGKSTMVKLLAAKYNGIACEENYHNKLIADLDSQEFPGLTYTRDLQNWSDFICILCYKAGQGNCDGCVI